MRQLRKIIHIDMDAFYASVEQRDAPELVGKPVIVGGDPNHRGVVAACSYEARKFGIHSAMASSTAYKLCPDAIFIRPRFDVYKAVSSEIREIFHEYTDLVEPLSLDEAFLDVTENFKQMASATLISKEIKKQIYSRTGGLTASAGVSFNKFLAKVASDINKPDGITVVTPAMAADFIDGLPIRKFFGVGRVTEEKMIGFGIKTGAELKKFKKEKLIQIFGKSGSYFYDISPGHDDRPVEPNRIRKSIGKETTLREDIDDKDQMLEILEDITLKLEDYLFRHDAKGRTITLKIKYFDFKSITRSVTLDEPAVTASVIMKNIKDLLSKTEAGAKKVRLLGISISNFQVPKIAVGKKGQQPLPLTFSGGEVEGY
ncbi:DNA polymerase IV (EC [Olavius algarvensis Delta 1 endosymbiont]|nr:DNA polymerase IV (EC [Olavius algarvensis Delta 1 endosymbiont]